jgi:hypothetical protein
MPDRRVEVVEAKFTPDLPKDRARLLVALLFGVQFERESSERGEPEEAN